MTEKTDIYAGDMAAFAAELKRCRREAGLKQAELAERAGVNRTTISDAERRVKIPKPLLIRLIADGLATDAEGHRDAARAEAFYARLLPRAAGLTAEPRVLHEPPAAYRLDPLADRLEAAFGTDARMLTDFLEQAADLDDSDREFMLSVVRWLRSTMPRGAARRRAGVAFPP